MRINEQGQLVEDNGVMAMENKAENPHMEDSPTPAPSKEKKGKSAEAKMIEEAQKKAEKFLFVVHQEIPVQLSWYAGQMMHITESLFTNTSQEVQAILKKYSPRIIARAIAILSCNLRAKNLSNQYEKSNVLAKAILAIAEKEVNHDIYGNAGDDGGSE